MTRYFRNGEFKLEDGHLYRKANEGGVAIWVCITQWMVSPVEQLLVDFLVEACEK